MPNESIDVSELTPDENQSSFGVGITSDFIASTIETAVDAAEDLPHFWINRPPRFYRKRNENSFTMNHLETQLEKDDIRFQFEFSPSALSQ